MKTTFIQYRDALEANFNRLAKISNIYQSQMIKDVQWDEYLGAYPEGTNLHYRERTEHDCNCCKRYIRNVGRVLFVVDGEIVSVFRDLPITGEYKVVSDHLAKLNEESGIAGMYLNDSHMVGVKHSYEGVSTEDTVQWNHFYQELPDNAFTLSGDVSARKAQLQTNRKCLKRSVEELSDYSVELVLDLIANKQIHRGDQFAPIVKGLDRVKRNYEAAVNKGVSLWESAVELTKAGHDCNIRNTHIGTLLQDITDGVELEVAVKKYEDKVSGTNFRRSTTLATPKLKAECIETAEKLGIAPSIPRRNANKGDLSPDDVLFADQSVVPKMAMSIFDSVTTKSKPINTKKFDSVDETSYDDFVKNILPSAESLEVFVEGKHESNLMSLITAVNPEAPCIMNWGNNTSWSYNGDFAESVITQRVKQAGGVVDAEFVASLSWDNRNDYDFWLEQPSGRNKVYFSNKTSITGFKLDVDMQGERLNQVENIYNNNIKNAPAGNYKLRVNNYANNRAYSGEVPVEGFQVQIKNREEITTLSYPTEVRFNQIIDVADVEITTSGEVIVTPLIASDCSSSGNTVWGVETGQFHKVDMVMKSPNYWDNSNKSGNEHLFFILEDCVNPDSTRGMYNEYLIKELFPYRKVFETLAGEMKAAYSEDQLSGLGFSTTLRNKVTIRVKGEFNRVIKVVF